MKVLLINGSAHAKGNTFYVSVAFNEIVSYTGTRKLNTNWGELSYVDGDGTNVLTFSGIIPQEATENTIVIAIIADAILFIRFFNCKIVFGSVDN